MKKLLIIGFLCLSSIGYAQVVDSFYTHLSEHNLKREQTCFIEKLNTKPPSDSVHYFNALFHFQYFDDSLFFAHYAKSKMLFMADTVQLLRTSKQLLTFEKHTQTHWFTSLADSPLPFSVQQVYSVYNASIHPRQVQVESLPIELQSDFLTYKKYAYKKKIVAGTLSAVVPGLGKLYVGRKRSFLTTLLINGLLAAQTTESIYKLGGLHPFSILSMGTFGVFYLSNIYGSYYEVNTVRSEKQTEFLIHATDYFNITYPTSY